MNDKPEKEMYLQILMMAILSYLVKSYIGVVNYFDLQGTQLAVSTREIVFPNDRRISIFRSWRSTYSAFIKGLDMPIDKPYLK